MAQIKRKGSSGGGSIASYLPIVIVAIVAAFATGYQKGHQDGYSTKVIDRVRTMNDERNNNDDNTTTEASPSIKCPDVDAIVADKTRALEDELKKYKASSSSSSSTTTKSSSSTAALGVPPLGKDDTQDESVPLVLADVPEGQQDFLELAKAHGTDKVAARAKLPSCLSNNNSCTRKDCKRPECRPWGHYYDTMYQRRLGHLSTKDTEPFQFLEIGYFHGYGFDAYQDFFPNAEAHSMEISCIEHGPRDEGKWPWDNFAAVNKQYKSLLQADRLHCGDANEVDFLHKIWTEKMKRPDAPPLKVVVDDGAHIAEHMAQSVLFWFPRIEPGGFMIVEDVQPIPEANKFRTDILPQLMVDVHYCGGPDVPDEPCFPTIQPLLQSIHCEMHICILERNQKPSVEMSLAESTFDKAQLDLSTCKSYSRFQKGSGGGRIRARQ